MSKTVGDIAISVGADISHLKAGMREGAGHVRRFGKDADSTGTRMAKMGKIAGAAAVATATAVGALAIKGAQAAKDLENLARVANANVEDFQRMAFAARTVGVEQDKLSDILKDVNDRVGDFLSTGAGPMADFFEYIAPQVGVTAEQFATLSGPEALGLYVSSLEKANLNQQEMTFYLEAMASDATALLPLLRDGGKGMSELAAQASNLGIVLSEETVARAADAQETMGELAAVFDVVATKIASGLAPSLEALVDLFTGGVGAVFDWIDAMNDAINPKSELEVITDNLVAAMGDEIQQSQLLDAALGQGAKMSVAAAQQKYNEAKARHENVRAIIAENRALALGSTEWSDLTASIGDAQSALNASGFPSIDAAPAHRADAFEEQQQHLADLIVKRQALLDVDEAMNDQLERTEENMRALDEALAGASGGVVSVGGDVIRPIDPSERDENGGGGGGPAERFSEADFERLQSDFATERELLQQGYDARLELLREYRESKLGTEQEYNELEARVKAEHEQALADLEARRKEATLSGMAGMFGDLSSLMQSGNKKLFNIGKAAAIAEATVKGYQSAVSAWEKGMKIGGPPLAGAFAAASVVKTGMLISNIASTSHNGGGGGAAGGGGGVASTPAAAVPAAEAQQVNINLGDQNLFSRGMVLGLIDELNEAVADGAKITVG